MTLLSDWVIFFSGDYDLWTKNPSSGVWESIGILKINFTPNTNNCLKAQFVPVGNLNLTMEQGFFHLMNESGAHHQAQTHPNDWYGSGVTSDPFLSGGVMEGSIQGSSTNFFRFGFWEILDNGDNTFYPRGVPALGEFRGKTYKRWLGETRVTPVAEHKLRSRVKKLRPDVNYPWNT